MPKYTPGQGFDTADWNELDELELISAISRYHERTGADWGDSKQGHSVFHLVAERHLIDDELPEARLLFDRLMAEDGDAHDSLHGIAHVVSMQIWHTMKAADGGEPPNAATPTKLLRELRGAYRQAIEYGVRAAWCTWDDEIELTNDSEIFEPENFPEELCEEADSWLDWIMEAFARSPEGQSTSLEGWAKAVVYDLMLTGLMPREFVAKELPELLLDSVPLGLDCGPEHAPAILEELRAFFRFAAREFDWPEGEACAQTIEGDIFVRRLAESINNRPDFELLAENMRMAGYDPESAEAMQRFTDAVMDNPEASALMREFTHEPGPPAKVLPFKRAEPKVGRNDPCPCGSGKKSKSCCAT